MADSESKVSGGIAGWFGESRSRIVGWLNQANGWQRLWVVGTILWCAFVTFKILTQIPDLTSYEQALGGTWSGIGGPYCYPTSNIDWDQTQENTLSFTLLYIFLLIGVPVASYAIGAAISWVGSGFSRRTI